MELALATFVRLDERTDEEHRRARRPHEVREHRPEREKARVDDRTPDEGAAHVNAARHNEKRPYEDEEGYVIDEQNVDDRVETGRDAEEPHERNRTAERPEDGDLAEVVMPEVGSEKREERDREQNARKRDGPGQTEFGAVETRRERSRRHEGPDRRERTQKRRSRHEWTPL